MKTTSFLTLASLATFVAAQSVSLTGLPKCASSCLSTSSLSNLGCSSSLDFKCICSNKSFVSGLSCCVKKACDDSDIQKTIKFANGICAQASVTLPSVASCASTATSSAGSSTGAPGTTSSAASGSSGSSASSASSASAASASSASTASTYSTAAASSTASTGSTAAASTTGTSSAASVASTSATHSTGAAAQFVYQGASVAGGLAAALAALL